MQALELLLRPLQLLELLQLLLLLAGSPSRVTAVIRIFLALRARFVKPHLGYA